MGNMDERGLAAQPGGTGLLDGPGSAQDPQWAGMRGGRAAEPAGALGTTSGWTAALALLGLAGVHVAWALGSTWPVADAGELARTVVGVEPDRMPGPAPTLTVAALLTTAAGLLAARASSRGGPGLQRLAGTGSAGVATVLGLRGLGGLAMSLPQVLAGQPTSFARWDAALYSPLCLTLAGLAAACARSPRSSPR